MLQSIYLDTTIPSYYFENRKSLLFQNNVTKNWFKEESDKYKLFISEATIFELQKGDYPNNNKLLKVTTQILC
jgi:hypothetical protein